MVSFCYRRTFIDEAPAVPQPRPRSWTEPAGGLGMSEEQVNGEEQVRVCVSRAELLTAELHVPVHVQESTPTEAYKQGDASIPDVLLQVASATGQASDQTQVTESNCGGKLSKGGKIFELCAAAAGKTQRHGADEAEADFEEPGVLPRHNPGSRGHPECCRKVCAFNQTKVCTNGSSCGYCHLPHKLRVKLPNRQQREIIRACSAVNIVAFVLPYLERRAEKVGSKANEVLQTLERELRMERSRAGLEAAVVTAEEMADLRRTLARMSFGALISLVFRKVGHAPWLDESKAAWEAMRQALN